VNTISPARTKGAAGKEFVISRVFDAPRKLVWEAFTTRDHLMHWWGPKGFKMIAGKLDLRPDGYFHYGMQGPDGVEMWGKWVFKEIVAPEKLSFVFFFSDKDGGMTRHPMAPDWPLEMLGTAVFTDQGDKTLLTNTVAAYNATDTEIKTFEANFDSMRQGFGGTWDQLAEYLPKLTA
jgi:uncharacterized protein YndB with AHSA1/START domain